MSKVLGIDLGTYKCVSAFITNKALPQIISHEDGDEVLLSLVYYSGHNDFQIGKMAQQSGRKDPENLITSIKNFMGRDYDDPIIQGFIQSQHYPYIIEKDSNGEVIVCMGGRYFSPSEITAFMLEALKGYGETHTKDTIRSVVITVPAYYGTRQKETVLQAAHMAGLRVLQLLPEPTAAALAYRSEVNTDEPQTVLVYNLGASSLDVTILSIDNSGIIEKGTSSELSLGGDKFDERIVDELVREIQNKYGVDVRTLPNNKEVLGELKFEAEKAKTKLTRYPKSQIVLQGLIHKDGEDTNIEYELDRRKFNNLINDLVKRTTDVIHSAIKKANTVIDEIDAVIITGGASRIPLVQEELRGLFGAKVDRQMNNPMLSVALGAAIQTLYIDPTDVDNQPDPSIIRCDACGAYNLKLRADCRRCGAIIPASAAIFQPEVIPQPSVECPECGASNELGSKKCKKCGKSLRTHETYTAPDSNGPASTERVEPQEPDQQGKQQVEENIPKPPAKGDTSPRPIGYQRLEAAALIKTGDLEKARTLLPQIKDASLWMWLGKAYADLGQLKQAAEAYGEAVRIDPQNKDAAVTLVSLLHKMAVQHAQKKEWDLAGAYLRQAIELDPNNQSVHNLLDAVDILGLTSDLNFKQLETGIPILEKIQEKDFTRVDVAHQLAIFYHRKAIADEDISNLKNGHNWEKAFANWALMLSNPAYWQHWMRSRQKAYEHDLTDQELKEIRQQSIPDILKKLHGQYITAYGKADQIAGVNRHKQLQARLSLEINTARYLEEVLSFLIKSNQPAKLQVACGPMMWEQFKLSAEVEAAAKTALSLDRKFEPAQKVLDALKSTALIRAYLSEGLMDEAIAMLEKELGNNPKDKSMRDLLQRAYLEKLKTMVNLPLREAKKIFEKARKLGLDTQEMEVEYAQQVLVKADQAYNDGDLDEADKILRDALSIVPNNQNLKDKLAAVTNRRVKLLVEGGLEKDPSKAQTYLDKGRAILQEVDKVIGPNHPALMEHLASLRKIQAQLQVGGAISRANKAIENYTPGVNYDSTIRELDSVLADLKAGLRADPGNSHISQQIDELNKVRTGISGAEATYYNEKAKKLVESAASSFKSGYRSSGISDLKEARDALRIAVRLNPYDNTLQENLNFVEGLLRQAGVY